MRMMPKLRIQA